MAIVKSPLLSIGAAGQVGKSQVYAKWRGVPYVRQHVVPSNPRSTAQVLTRDVFTRLSDLYKLLGPFSLAPWAAYIVGKPMTSRNAHTKSNLPVLRGQTDLHAYVGSPGNGGGLPPSALAAAATANAGELEVTITAPAAPTGWTLSGVYACAMRNRAPEAALIGVPVEGEDATPTAGGSNTVLFTGLTSGQEYIATGWLKWTRTDGQVVYGPSLVHWATPAS